MADKPVALSDDSVRTLVKAVTDSITDSMARTRESELLNHFQRFAQEKMDLMEARRQTEAQLADAQREVRRLEQEVATQRAHIGSLNGLLTSMTNGNGHQGYPLLVPPAPIFPPQPAPLSDSAA